MASTYIVKATAVPFASSKHMITLWNPASSGKILRVYRVWTENNQIAAVTGVTTILKLFRITTHSSGVVLVPQSYDSTNTALGTVTAATGATATTSSLFRNYYLSNDELTAAAGTCDEWQQYSAINEIWNSGTRNTAIDPIVIRETQGISVQNSTATTVGNMDFFIEFTVE
jgi:hypothetical protein